MDFESANWWVSSKACSRRPGRTETVPFHAALRLRDGINARIRRSRRDSTSMEKIAVNGYRIHSTRGGAHGPHPEPCRAGRAHFTRNSANPSHDKLCKVSRLAM